jgi:DNA-directed RNA polymerase subunit RPC12/RpoP
MNSSNPRPILRLKNPPKLAPLAPTAPSWKCKPCGEPFAPTEAADADGDVRCPRCNARVGKLEDFTARPPRLAKLRARPMVRPAAPAKPGKRLD